MLLLATVAGPPAVDAATPESPVQADTVPLAEAIVLRSGATCLESARLVAQVGSWIERDHIDARLIVEVVGDATNPRRLAFSLRRGEDIIAVRRFDPAPARCSDLHAVVGLAVALALDATLLENLQREPPEVPVVLAPALEPIAEPPPEVRPPVVPSTKPADVTVKTTQPRPRRWMLWSEIAGAFTIGAPPGTGGGVRFGLYARWRELIDLGAGMVAQSSGAERVGDGTALMSAVAGRVDVCAGPRLGRVRLRGCTGLLAGAALAAGQGFSNDATLRLAWVAIPIGLRIEARVGPRFSLIFGVEGQGTAIRPTFDATNLAGVRSSRSFAKFAAVLEAGLAVLVW